MTATTIHKGGCHCGGVRYQTAAELRPVLVCHCYDCMKTIGNSIAATAAPEDEIEITETTLQWYRSSPVAQRGFCNHCGASLFFRADGSGRLSISAGTLDDASGLTCAGQIYAHAHHGFMPLPEGLEDLDEAYLRGDIGDTGRISNTGKSNTKEKD